MAELGDPKNMRPSDRRLDFSSDDPIGEYRLSNGRTIQVIWLTIDQTRCNVVAWEVGATPTATMKTVENVNRLQASAASDRLLDEFEKLP
jgi:hypothetical protein